ncbi:MAG TPA: 16S rRNA (cytosine(1402)-N(4))-methyltransferase RsmH [Polyangiaceae bacterium]|nr:16S rRNA (cytosine(1402)-N(4))-methyltransferase RsmH [Polyangiaceae bacterium]
MTEAALRLTEEVPPSHVSVMAHEIVAALSPRRGDVFLDATAGAGGHSEILLEAANEVKVIAFDRDPLAVTRTRERLARFGARAQVVHLEFARIEEWLREHRIPAASGLIADLGLSSPQLSEAKRGMSFRLEGPIDMRMDPTHGETARELIERASQDELADLIYLYGGERRSRRVARCLKQALEQDKLTSTLELRKAVVRAVGPQRVGGIDPATKTFQALRIAVNGELDQLDALLESLPAIVAPGGVAAMISFHSLEDRKVKQAFLDSTRFERLTKKPLLASTEELDENPRSRSAKLRAARLVRPLWDAPESGSGPSAA